MKDAELPTIKGELAKMEASLRYDLTFSSMPRDRVITLAFNEIIKVYDEVLLAHEQHAKEMMKETSQTPILWNYWRGRYDEARSYKEVQSPDMLDKPAENGENVTSPTPQVSKSQKGEVKK